MAHKLFGALPVGCIILFSKLEVPSAPHHRDLQACYQVSISGGKFLISHTEEMPPHGLAQIVNHPVRDNPDTSSLSHQAEHDCRQLFSDNEQLSRIGQEYQRLPCLPQDHRACSEGP